MTTHRRAWITRAGVVLALAAGALVASPATPALAEPKIEVVGQPTTTLNPGQRVTLNIRVRNAAPQDENAGEESFSLSVTSTFGELRCVEGCSNSKIIPRGGAEIFTVTLAAGNVGAGQSKSGQIQIQVQGPDGSSASDSRTFTVRSTTPPMVRSITGKVTDIETGRPIAGAIVAMSDSQNHRYSTTTDANGTYRFVSSASSPISPGEIVIAAEAENYSRSDFKKITAAAGQAVTGPTLALRSTASPSPSASPSPTPEAEEDEEAPAEEQTPAAANNNPTSSSQSDGGGFGSWLLILLGGLLVAIGVGAIVLLLVRRKENLDEESPESDEASGSYRSGDDGYRAGDDATRVAPRQDAEPTMVASSLADAPTMVQHVPPVKDEYPDPYGAPAPAGAPAGPPPSGYGSTGSGYPSSNDATAIIEGGLGGGYQPPAGGSGGYGSPTSGGPSYGAPEPAHASYGPPPSEPAGGYSGSSYGGGYGSPSGDSGYAGRDYGSPAGGGYGSPAQGGYSGRYDEPTSRYDSGPGSYSSSGSSYESSSSSYESSSYGQADPGRGGYGRESGYGGSGGYDAPRSGGYGGYEQPYSPPSGYDPANPGYGSGGYGQGGYGSSGPEQGPGGYGDRGYEQGYYDRPAADGPARHGAAPPPPPPGHAERRPGDWLDN